MSSWDSPDLNISCRTAVVKRREDLVAKTNNIIESLGADEMPNILQISLASLVLNFSLHLVSSPDQEAAVQIVSALGTNYLLELKAPEALYRTLVALGTLVARDSEVRDLALALDVASSLSRVKSGQLEKLDECLNECKQALKD